MLNRTTILILVIVLTPFLVGGGCPRSRYYGATIYNNSDQDVQLSFFSDYARTEVDQITLAPSDYFPMTLTLDFVQTITVQIEGLEAVEHEFANPGVMGDCAGHLDIYICVSEGTIQLTEIANHYPASAGTFWTVSGDQFVLPDVGFPWYEHPDNGIGVDLVAGEGTVIAFEAPHVEEAIPLELYSDGCADSAAFQMLVEVLPAPAYIIVDPELALLVDGDRHGLIGSGWTVMGQEFELTADMRGRDPDLYTITWSAEPERMASFDDNSTVTTTVALLDVGWVMVTLKVTDNETGLYAEDTLRFYEVVYDGAGLEVDAGMDETVRSGAPIELGATPYGADVEQSCRSSGETDTTRYVWRQDEHNPAPWSEVSTFVCGIGGWTEVPSPAPDSIEARFVRFRSTEAGTYRFDVTATDPTGTFQDTDYVLITVNSE